MRSNFKAASLNLVSLSTLALLTSACGILGPRDDIDNFVRHSQESGSCLRGSDSLIDNYLKGNLSEEEVAAPFDCAQDKIDMFTQFVRSSNPKGYTANDMHALITGILTDKPVSNELVTAGFILKSSLMGGTTDLITPVELTHVKRIIQTAKLSALSVLPHLQRRTHSPTASDLILLTHAINAAVDSILVEVGPPGEIGVDRDTIDILTLQLDDLLNKKFPGNLTSTIIAGKRILAAGSANVIEPQAWNSILRVSSSLLAVYAAATALPTDEKNKTEVPALITELAHQVESALARTFASHANQAIPFARIDTLIDVLEDGTLPVRKATAHELLRILVNRMFPSGPAETINAASVRQLVATLETWSAGAQNIETIFARSGIPSDNTTTAAFIAAAEQYRLTLPTDQQGPVERLKRLAQTYVPLYEQGDDRIMLRHSLAFTKTHIETFNWLNLISTKVLTSWSSTPKSSTISLGDFEKMFGELRNVFLDTKAMDPGIPQLHERRFREADLFTHAGNGDGVVDEAELTYLFAFLTSISAEADAVRADVEVACAIGSDTDPIGWLKMNIGCFRKHYFHDTETYWSHMPLLARHYQNLNAAGKTGIEASMEAGARLEGMNELPIAGYDTQAFLGVANYVEALFMRFDANHDDTLDVPELLKAFPTFRKTIADVGGIAYGQKSTLEAIFTYLIKKGHPPEKNVGGYLDLGSWIVSRPLWKINANRSDVYKIVSFFNSYK